MASILRRKQPFWKAKRNQILDVCSEDLPNELLSEILSYLSKKEKLGVSLVNQRWFQNINRQIEDIRIRRPTNTENLEDLQNLIKRFPLKSLSLASQVNSYSELLPLKSLDLKGKSIEFDVGLNLIQTKAGEMVFFGGPATRIKRIKVEDFEKFARFEYKPSQVICFEVWSPEDFERVNEEIMSLNSLRSISLRFASVVIPSGFFEAILTRPTLKQIDFWISNSGLGFEIEQEFIKNSMVEEITFRFSTSPPF
jgi:hypothetical protein